jgi:hypothetical protein
VLVSADAEAFFDRDRRAIHLIATAPAFVDAMAYVKRRQNCSHRPSLALIASILAHEEHHLRRGPGEAAAYAHQLTTLNILGYGPGSQPYHRVQLAMLAVASRAARQPLTRQSRVPRVPAARACLPELHCGQRVAAPRPGCRTDAGRTRENRCIDMGVLHLDGRASPAIRG